MIVTDMLLIFLKKDDKTTDYLSSDSTAWINIFEYPHIPLIKLNQLIPKFPKIQLSLNPLIIGIGNAINIWARFDIGKLINGTHNLGKSLRPLIRAINTIVLSGRANVNIVQR